MSSISSGAPVIAESVSAYYNTSKTSKKTEEKKEDIAVTKKEETAESTKKTRASGRTIGNPELTEKAAKYYEELKKKYGNLDFILVSKDQKDFAKATASKYSNPHKMVVLIDEEKIERMAEDEKYRQQYEGIIAKGASGLTQLKSKLANMGLNMKSCGMNVYDNGATSFFATMDKSFKAQNKTAKQRLEKKKAAKKAEQKKQQEKLEANREERRVIREEYFENDNEDEITFTADSIEDLIDQIEGADYLLGRDTSANSRRQVGRGVDFTI